MNWDEYFFNLIDAVSKKSKDRTQVGCVIVAGEHEILATGFNGFPRRVKETPERCNNRDLKIRFTEHAEKNAIFASAKKGVALENSILYIGWYPCRDCMKGVIQSGIKEIVINGDSESYNDKELYERWKESIEDGIQMASEAGVKLRVVKTK